MRIFLAVLFLFFCQDVFCRDIFVSSRFGDDRNSGLNESDSGLQNGPVRTIKRGLELVRVGDRLVLDPSEPYKESVTLSGKNVSGRIIEGENKIDHAFVIEGRGAILDGTDIVPVDAWEFYKDDVFRFKLATPNINITFFHIMENGSLLKRVNTAIDSNKIPPLDPNSWCVVRGYVYFRAEGKKSPTNEGDYNFTYSKKIAGITIVQAKNIKINDLIVQGYQLDGIAAINGADGVVLDNVTCRLNGRSGLAIGGASSVAAGFSEFTQNKKTQILLLKYAHYIFHNCTITKNGITKSKK